MNEMKTCLDCLYCRVSRTSTGKNRLFFCSEKKKQVKHTENYWQTKKHCDEFEDMTETAYSEKVFEKKLALYPVPKNPLKKLKPLLRKRA
jgi:hypothetical protein